MWYEMAPLREKHLWPVKKVSPFMEYKIRHWLYFVRVDIRNSLLLDFKKKQTIKMTASICLFCRFWRSGETNEIFYRLITTELISTSNWNFSVVVAVENSFQIVWSELLHILKWINRLAGYLIFGYLNCLMWLKVLHNTEESIFSWSTITWPSFF